MSWKKQLDSPEKKEKLREARSWDIVSGGILGLTGILLFFWLARFDLLFGLLFWGMFAAGFFFQIIYGVMIGQKTAVIEDRKLQLKAMYRGVLKGLAYGLGSSFVILAILFILPLLASR